MNLSNFYIHGTLRMLGLTYAGSNAGTVFKLVDWRLLITILMAPGGKLTVI